MKIIDNIMANRTAILKIAANHGAHNVRIFGSVARDQAGEDSDVDFLVLFDKARSLMDHAGMLVDLEELLGRKVDVVPENTLRERIRERVLKEAIPL